MFTLTGTLKVKGTEQQISDKFRKREFVLTDNSSQYPQHVSFQLTQDKCSLIEPYSVGSEVKVFFNLRGREWVNPQGETKYFNSLEAWKLENVGNSSAGNSETESEPEQITASTFTAQDDDLPF